MSNITNIWIKFKETNSSTYKNELIEHYVYLVKIVAGRLYNYYGRSVEFDDLLGYGIIGLIDAVEKFDVDRNIKFETYAQIRIRGSIIDNLRKLDWIPRSLRQKSKMIEDTIKKMENIHGKDFKLDFVADELNITINELEKILNQINTFNVVSLDEILNVNETVIDNDYSDNPENSYQTKELKKILTTTIDDLPEKEKLVISLYYYDELTYKEIAKVLGVSESRISQINSKAIATIRNNLLKLGVISG